MTKTFEHILVPYNGTTGSEKAFRKTVFMAMVMNANITILTCLEERHTFGFFKTKTSKQEFEKERHQVEMKHKKLQDFAAEHNVSCHTRIVKNGMASIKILEFVHEQNIDLIVMTKTKLTSHFEKQHYHSTVENVVRNTSCPILIL